MILEVLWLAGSVSLRPVERQTTWLQKHVRKEEDVQFLAAGKKRGGPVFFSRQNKFPPFPKWGLSLERTPVWAFAMSYEHQCTNTCPYSGAPNPSSTLSAQFTNTQDAESWIWRGRCDQLAAGMYTFIRQD